MMMKRAVSAVLIVLMLLSATAACAAESRQSGKASYRFKDMNGHWAEDTVARLAGNGIVTGKGGAIFDPEGSVTRAEFVALLIRGLDIAVPKGAKDPGFADVKKGDWYYSYVVNAYANGILDGIEGGVFDPNGKITRELMVKMMADALKLQKLDVDWQELAYKTKRYKDWNKVSSWARDKMEKAVMLGLIKGKHPDMLAPRETATRAEAATIIERMLEVDEYISAIKDKELPKAEALKPEAIQKKVKLFSDASVFNRKIAPDARVDESSALMVKSLVEAQSTRGMLVAKGSYSVAVYYADANTPRYDVRRVASWAGGTTLNDVPIPDYAVPDPGEGHMAIIDLSTGYEYDLWLAKKSGGAWTAGWANRISYGGDGVYPDGLAARGSGIALTAGLIWPEELKRGRIDHALIFSYPFTKAKKYVYPASKTDGTSTRADAIPEGARVQLDPDLDLDTLGLTSYERTIALALQEYGMILCDTSGGPIELEAVNPISAWGDSYAGLLPNETYVFLRKIPAERLRVLDIN